MAILAASKIAKSFGERVLFSDVSFEIAERDKIGFIGQNGTGKTTLFNILLKRQEADEGHVYHQRDATICALDQNPDIDFEKSVYDTVLGAFSHVMAIERDLDAVSESIQHASEAELNTLIAKQQRLQDEFERKDGLTYKSRARAALLGLGFTDARMNERVGVLSGGELNKVMLARLLLLGANVLFLDEPTNHLDVTATQWLENFLIAYPGAVFVISHDRYFLDRVTKRTFALQNSKLIITEGNYSTHVERQSTEEEIVLRHYQNTQREIKRIEGIVEQQRRWGREKNIKTAESKLKQIDKLKQTLVVPEKKSENIKFTFGAKNFPGNEVLFVDELKKSFDGRTLFSGASFLLRKSERVFLLGPNGAGKTTLFNIVANRASADEGRVLPGAGVQVAYYEQNMRSLDPDKSVEQSIWDAFPLMTKTNIRNALAAFLFRGEESVAKKISMLSGGEKARVQLLKLMLSGANLLLLDEPTNHLDIGAREALENALDGYDGTLFIVTHDRYLVNRLADRVLYMQDDGIIESIGGYDALLETLERTETEAPTKANEVVKSNQSYHAKKERKAAANRARGALKRAEENIASLEAEIAADEEALIACGADYKAAGELASAIDVKKQQLEELYNEWEAAEEMLLAATQEEE